MLNVMKKVVKFFIFITFLFGSLSSKFLTFTLPAKIYEKIKDIAKWAFQFYAFIKRQIALKSTKHCQFQLGILYIKIKHPHTILFCMIVQ